MPLQLFRPLPWDQSLWGGRAQDAVLQSLFAAGVTSTLADRARWEVLRDLLDGLHQAHVQAAAALSHPERHLEWDKGDGAGYRYFRFVQMLAEQLSVAFHRPPELTLHTGDGVPLEADDPKYGAQVRQWEQDREDAEQMVKMGQAARGAADAIITDVLARSDERSEEPKNHLTCRKCGAVVEITHETAQAIHFATGLCKACLREAKP